MCGIFGVCSPFAPVDGGLLARATHAAAHRGPDGWGFLVADIGTGRGVACKDPSEAPLRGTAALGHRRLSIIDLSEAAGQPMGNADGSVWIVFNGEIYNYIELRAKLSARGCVFRTASDTEVILAAYEVWGEECLHWLNGMWAFGILDLRSRTLFCARDRVGVKPFYYHADGRRFVFASEIKQLLEDPSIARDMHPGIAYDYLAHGFTDHSEATFFRSIRQLRGGCCLTVGLSGARLDPVVRPYWSVDPERKATGLSDAACAEGFLGHLTDSIRLRLRSDVPVGSCLSGGIDSTSIVCIANRLLREGGGAWNQNAFSSCFEDRKYDERMYIEAAARGTGVKTHYVFPGPGDLVAELPRLLRHHDEPFGSTSVYAQWCVFRLAAEHGVKVMLDGQGADELLAGYPFYFHPFLADLVGRGTPGAIGAEARGLRRNHGLSVADLVKGALAGLLRPRPPLFRAARRLAGIDPERVLSREFVAEGRKASEYERVAEERKTSRLAHALHDSFFRTNLPALLRYEDRNAMAHGVESRVPFLDYRLVEYAFALPDDQKIRGGVTKFVLRNAVRGIVPDVIVDRMDKMGFVTPEDRWLGTDLRDAWLRAAAEAPADVFHKGRLAARLEAVRSGKEPFSFAPWRWANFALWRNAAAGGTDRI